MAILAFLRDIKHEPVRDFWSLDEHDIPQVPGAYILFGRPGVRFNYPNAESPIYYIGQSKGLNTRLRSHLKWSTHVKNDERTVFPIYEPRYEYGGKLGGRYCYIRTWQGLGPKALEDILMARFAKKYGTFPVANGASAWNRIMHEFKEK
jgi:hypothetical protein